MGCSRPVTDDPVPVVSIDASSPDQSTDGGEFERDAERTSDVSPTGDGPEDSSPLGKVWNTDYWLADEAELPAAKTVEPLDPACDPIAPVSGFVGDLLRRLGASP